MANKHDAESGAAVAGAAPCSANPASDTEILDSLRRVIASMPPEARNDVATITIALKELVRRYGHTARIALIVYSSELLVEEDSPNDQAQ
jgi:hypothetical protein